MATADSFMSSLREQGTLIVMRLKIGKASPVLAKCITLVLAIPETYHPALPLLFTAEGHAQIRVARGAKNGASTAAREITLANMYDTVYNVLLICFVVVAGAVFDCGNQSRSKVAFVQQPQSSVAPSKAGSLCVIPHRHRKQA